MDITSFIFSSKLNMTNYEDLYRNLHKNPELSQQECSTASVVASHLRSFDGIEVKTGIGGHGVVGVLRNGPGKVILLRAELDALPVQEQTSLDYSSTKKMVDILDNSEKHVMHACGHDMHIASMLAAAQLLYMSRDHWKGTIVFLFQPSEEDGVGAKKMVDDGLYDPEIHAVPRPCIVLGGHVMPMRAGTVGIREGPFNSASESFRVTLYGRGGHGSRPHTTIDPVVLACSTVLKLQTIASREVDPQDRVVVTIGSIQSGTTANVIPQEATLLVNARSFNEKTQKKVRDSIRRIVSGESSASGSPRPPTIEQISWFPLLYNDHSAVRTFSKVMEEHFAADFSSNSPVSAGSEDISNLAHAVSAPVCFWNYGGIDPEKWDAAAAEDTISQIPGKTRSDVSIFFSDCERRESQCLFCTCHPANIDCSHENVCSGCFVLSAYLIMKVE